MARLLGALEAQFIEAGLDVQQKFVVFLGPLLSRQRQLLLGDLAKTNSLTRTMEIVSLLMENFFHRDKAGIPDVSEDDLVAQMETVLGSRIATVPTTDLQAARGAAQQAIAERYRNARDAVDQALSRHNQIGLLVPGDDYRPDLLTQLDQFFRSLAQRSSPSSAFFAAPRGPIPPGLAATMDAYPFTPDSMTNHLNDGQSLASLIIGLTDWAGTRLSGDAATVNNLQFALTNFTLSFTAAAEQQKDWWLIDRCQNALREHTAIYGTNVNGALRLAQQQARNASLLASSRIAGAFSNLLATVVTHNNVLVPLPGNVEITRIFGSLCYNRSSGLLNGCFGGRVEFPDIGSNVFFDISQACLNSDGSYQIAARSLAPLPFGRATLSSSLNISGSPSGIGAFAGSGTLTVPNGAAGNRVFTVTSSYDQPHERLTFDAQGNNLDMRFGDDFERGFTGRRVPRKRLGRHPGAATSTASLSRTDQFPVSGRQHRHGVHLLFQRLLVQPDQRHADPARHLPRRTMSYQRGPTQRTADWLGARKTDHR